MWLSTSKSKDGLSTKNYIVGAVEHSGLHLLVSSSEGYSKVKEAECCGIGCGMYPEVTKLLEEGYSANIDRTRLLILLYRAFDGMQPGLFSTLSDAISPYLNTPSDK